MPLPQQGTSTHISELNSDTRSTIRILLSMRLHVFDRLVMCLLNMTHGTQARMCTLPWQKKCIAPKVDGEPFLERSVPATCAVCSKDDYSYQKCLLM